MNFGCLRIRYLSFVFALFLNGKHTGFKLIKLFRTVLHSSFVLHIPSSPKRHLELENLKSLSFQQQNRKYKYYLFYEKVRRQIQT